MWNPLPRRSSEGRVTFRPRPIGEEAAVFFTRKAYCLLRDGGELAGYPSLRALNVHHCQFMPNRQLRYLGAFFERCVRSFAQLGSEDRLQPHASRCQMHRDPTARVRAVKRDAQRDVGKVAADLQLHIGSADIKMLPVTSSRR